MYAKLFASLYQGTLRGCSDEILVFTNLLAHADSTGVVDKHWRAISEEVGISRERVEAAITNLEAPDAESRSPEEGGRRIVKMDEHRVWGWRIVNYGKYRSIRSEEDRRAQNRAAQERWRNKQNKPRKPPSAQAEAEAEAISREESERAQARQTKGKANGQGTRLPEDWQPSPDLADFARDQGLDPTETRERFRDYWIAKPGSAGCKLNWEATWRNWCRNDAGKPGRKGVRSASTGGDAGAFARAAARLGGKEPFR